MFELIVSAFLAATAVQADAPAAAAAPVTAPIEGTVQPVASAEPAAPVAAEAAAKPKKICRRLGGTGSRLDTGKVCKTAAEWKRFDDEQ